MIDFTELLNKLHNELKISKTDLAKRSGLSLSYISLLTSGERKTPSIQTVNSLANAMALDAENRELLFKAAGLSGYVDSSLPIISRNMHSPNTLREDWGGAANVSVFYGRKEELVELEHRIVGTHSRVVAVVGLGGMGKTTLALKLTEQIKDSFDYLLWHSLQNAPP